MVEQEQSSTPESTNVHPTIARFRNGDPRWEHNPDLAGWIAEQLDPADRREILDRGTQRARVLIDSRVKLFHRNWDGTRRSESCATAFAVAVRQAILALEGEAAA